MSRLARKPILIPSGVEISEQEGLVTAKGKKGSMTYALDPLVTVQISGKEILVSGKKSTSMIGTTCKLLSNLMIGVNEGFVRKLVLVGVGYRAKVDKQGLELSLGFSHPVVYPIPEGISIETPSNTEILIKGSDLEKVGQLAATIRDIRPPEPYKGKGVRWADEKVEIKETKKKK